MNIKQIKRIQDITMPEWIKRYVKSNIAGDIAFSIYEIGNTVMLHASNTGTIQWFQKQVIFQIVVGPRGGINKIKIHAI
jgi:hypothetical protein